MMIIVAANWSISVYDSFFNRTLDLRQSKVEARIIQQTLLILIENVLR